MREAGSLAGVLTQAQFSFPSLRRVTESPRLLLNVQFGTVSDLIIVLLPPSPKARADFLSNFTPKCLGIFELVFFQAHGWVVFLSYQMPLLVPNEHSWHF